MPSYCREKCGLLKQQQEIIKEYGAPKLVCPYVAKRLVGFTVERQFVGEEPPENVAEGAKNAAGYFEDLAKDCADYVKEGGVTSLSQVATVEAGRVAKVLNQHVSRIA